MGAEGELLRRIADALARADLEADALVDEAWQAARAEVRTVLQRAFQQELLARVADTIEGPPTRREPPTRSEPPARSEPLAASGPPSRSEPPARSEPEPVPRSESPARPEAPARSEPAAATAPAAPPEVVTTYVFGITRRTADLDPDLPRVPGGGPVRAVDHGDLRAVVCDVDPDALRSLEDLGPTDLDRLASAANAHDEVLARVAARGPVLPLRLGTALADDRTVRDLLEANGAVLDRELTRVEGHAEWAVVVRVTDRAADDGRRPDVAGGADYLRARQASLAAREDRFEARERLASEVHERLASFAVDARTIDKRPLEQVPPALHGVYLLPWDRIDPFEDAVDVARAAHPEAIIEASGPWPPYHFTSVDLTLDDERAP